MRAEVWEPRDLGLLWDVVGIRHADAIVIADSKRRMDALSWRAGLVVRESKHDEDGPVPECLVEGGLAQLLFEVPQVVVDLASIAIDVLLVRRDGQSARQPSDAAHTCVLGLSGSAAEGIAPSSLRRSASMRAEKSSGGWERSIDVVRRLASLPSSMIETSVEGPCLPPAGK